MNKYFCILSLFLISLAGELSAQMESAAFSATGRGGVSTTFATDYQTIGINPANLGFHKSFRDPKVTFGILEANTTFFAEAMNRQELLGAIFHSKEVQFSTEEKQAAAEKIANTALSLNTDVMLLGASLQLPNSQGIAFSVRDRIQLYAQINKNAAEIAFNGATASYFPALLLSNGDVIPNPRHEANNITDKTLPQEIADQVINGLFVDETRAGNYSEILDGSKISSSWLREFNLSYGKKLYDSYNFSLYAGAGVKYLQGIMLIELVAENGQLTASNISLSNDFGLDFGDTAQVTNPTFRPPSDVSNFHRMSLPDPVGRGYGFDIGLTMVIKRNLYIGLALNNVGQMKWDGNVYQITDGKLVQFAGFGFDNYNILASSQGAFQFAGDKSPFAWEGSNSITNPLPSTIRFGASYELFNTYHVGMDVIIPRNNAPGNLASPLYAIGGDFRPYKILKVSMGFNFGGNNSSKVNIPLGVTYLARRGFYEAGIATRDIATYLANFGGGSTISFATGFLRFKI